MIRFSCKLDRNPDGMFEIWQWDKSNDTTDVSTKAEFGTVVMSLCDRSSESRWTLRNAPSAILLIMFLANRTTFSPSISLNILSLRISRRLSDKSTLFNSWLFTKHPDSTSVIRLDSSLRLDRWRNVEKSFGRTILIELL